MFYVYILENARGRFYIGHTDDLERRPREHNDSEGKAHCGKYTHKHGPWSFVWHEAHESKGEAMRREQAIKRWKSAVRICRELL